MLNSLFIANIAAQAASCLVEQAEKAADASPSPQVSSSAIRSKTEALAFDVEKLFMITEALWMILKEEHGYTDDVLVQKIQDVDLRDGKLDGKVAKAAERPKCSSCGRVVIRNKRDLCLYCGAPVAMKPFER